MHSPGNGMEWRLDIAWKGMNELIWIFVDFNLDGTKCT